MKSQSIPPCINRQATDHEQLIPPFAVMPKAPLDPGPFGVNIQFLVRSSQTDYQYSCVETALAPKTLGPSPHYHKTLDEVSLVLEGTLSVYVDGTVFEVPPGGMQMRPRGLLHTFWNATDKPLRFIDTFLNQNFDDYLEEFFMIMDEAAKSELGPADPAIGHRFAALDLEFDVVQFPDRRQEFVEEYGLIR